METIFHFPHRYMVKKNFGQKNLGKIICVEKKSLSKKILVKIGFFVKKNWVGLTPGREFMTPPPRK